MGFPDFDEFIRKLLFGIARQFKLVALLEEKILNRAKPNFKEDLPIIAEILSMDGKKILTLEDLKRMNEMFYNSSPPVFMPKDLWDKAKKNYDRLIKMEETLNYEDALVGHLALVYQSLFLAMTAGTGDKAYLKESLNEFSKLLDDIKKGKFNFRGSEGAL